MTEQLLEMRKQTIQMRDAILNINIEGNEIEAVGKCFLGYEYPKNHPIQTYRAKAIWCVLNGTWDDYIPLYSEGVDGGFRLCSDEEPPSEIQFLYYEEGLDIWNEGLDREMTKECILPEYSTIFMSTWSSPSLIFYGFVTLILRCQLR